MRIIHTSDWHLGRSLHGVDLLEHQAAYLDHLVDLTEDVRPVAVLVAGDVYDRAIPPLEAVALLSDTLTRLAALTHVVVTPGNHDSATRLGFGANVMRETVHIRSAPDRIGEPVLIESPDGTVAVYAIPYLDVDDARVRLADDPDEPLARSHEAVTTAALARIASDIKARRSKDPGVTAVAMAHLFAVGGLPSDSERDIRVGGVDGVPAGVFVDTSLDYVALGHLHGPQRITVPDADRPLVRYSGSPLAYSYSEKNHRKSTAVIDLNTLETELVEAPVPRRLTELRGSLESLLADTEHTQDWVHVTVVEDSRPPSLMAKIKDHFPHALHVSYEHAAAGAAVDRSFAVTPAHQPFEVAVRFVEHVTGIAPAEPEEAVLRETVEAVFAAQRSA
ncbi:exonuclease SbcCD subunit D [Myceligenerans indicum]|uniref:Nuclease SbcCD subunit D n=1 Tax=Myceligenerans indicum TaxID=2593663 RepID=A0ABS1LRE5_9MICO|nr:exonuclease SbcCD subunit D [Myceligenerans indicum]MBL0888881.1 exonuclease SbcCD subunit D [Myceligenerans indicum]